MSYLLRVPPAPAGISSLMVLIADGGRGGHLKRRVTGVSSVRVFDNLLILLFKNKVTPYLYHTVCAV